LPLLGILASPQGIFGDSLISSLASEQSATPSSTELESIQRGLPQLHSN